MIVTYKVLKEGCEPRVGEGDAGMDLKTDRDFTLLVGETKKIPLGVAFQIPEGKVFVGISARSSVALQGVYAHVGTIDQSFNGKEVCAILTNIGDNVPTFKKGERIVQAIPYTHGCWSKTEDDIDDANSKGGFGSSGRF